MSLIIGMIISFFTSLSGSFWKKAIDNSTLPNGLFILFGPAIGVFFIYLLVFIFGINTSIFSNYNVIFILFLAGILDGFGGLIEANTLKKIKISKVLPYNSFDKIIIIIIGFILYYGNEGYTSLITLSISILTVLIIILFNIDIKTFKFDKDIIPYLFAKFFYAISTLLIGKVLLEYTTLDIFSVIVFFYLGFHVIFNLILKKDFKELFKQSKIFYKYRLLTSIIGRTAFIGGFFIVESSGLMVASLLSFLGIVFSIFSMKYILGDTPNNKQILLAFIVVFMIGIGYYFK